jgi:hypothetical protein
VLTTSLALLGAYVGPWLLQLPPTEAAVFKDSLAEPSSRALLLIGSATVAAYGLVKRHREARPTAVATTTSATPQRRAA